jgi:hypothetical protein
MAHSIDSSAMSSSRTNERADSHRDVEHAGLAHTLFGDDAAEWKETLVGYLKVALPSSRGYIFKAKWSDGISVPECNR